jgi:dephospho-CoA kinase
MFILGLTGSIGMGKSTAAKMLRRLGVPIHDSDAVVHRLMSRGGAAVPAIAHHYPDAVRDGAVDRGALSRIAFHDPGVLKTLEAILHPLVRQSQTRFLARAAARRAPVVVLDIPLLFETGGDKRADVIAVVTAPPEVQRQRVLARGQMTEAEFEAILARQTPDSVKRLRADFVINTGFGFPYAEAQIDEIIETLRTRIRLATEEDDTCEKSSSIPKPPGSTPITPIPGRPTAS